MPLPPPPPFRHLH
ncbi:hypothetical protein TIFTF001_038607 [Ficus carica]|uniref:Uncharacterized protein n=1 Tax=Ficus carica TaxID=3494 RepID=A0AA88E7K8_FICCA|nr:hypothetical protein TIFTF001_038607 [Ficus carica]